ncbi:MAG: ribonuclease E/G [Hyphomonadaceae bacterium]|nr:ribonuclease E/G [Hyphomonadaceae bacterium]
MANKKMLIDAAHPEETRVVVLDGGRVDDFDFETQSKKQLRGNIYLAKVTRVEPSLQAAFVEYGGNRHGFLAFTEIHPDYYQIPVADREALKAEFEAVSGRAAQHDDSDNDDVEAAPEPEEGDAAEGEVADIEAAPPAAEAEAAAADEDDDDAAEERRRQILVRRYRIQEVIRRRQIMLVQVVKEERGNKGAALTTYLSLAGRYCVLMPNTGRGGGISRKITSAPDRKRLKKVANELEVPQGMGLIIRTAGAKRTKTEIKRDYEYLTRAWENIRDATLRSIAPALIYEESSLVKRAIRDLYGKDVDEIHVDGESAYKEAKDFIRMLMPSHAKRVHLWREPTPIFTRHGVEKQLESIYSPVVQLKSGGYIVINQTEALVAIDVNSGRATRERNIEQTALRTNMEAADEAARQMRLRDLAGLIVLDFIDMEESKNDRTVEKRMRDCLRFDRARVQMGKISGFGLLELSRQRRRTGVLEGSSHICPQCAGVGRVRSVESSALALLRALDEAAAQHGGERLEARAPAQVALYILNEKRAVLAAMEQNRDVRLRLAASETLLPPDYEIVSLGARPPEEAPAPAEDERARARREAADAAIEDEVDVEGDAEEPEDGEEASAAGTRSGPRREANGESGADGDHRRRRRRGRRGGRRREGSEDESQPQAAVAEDAAPHEAIAEPAEGEAAPGGGRRRRRRRRGRGRGADGAPAVDLSPAEFAEALNADIDDGVNGADDFEEAAPAEPVVIAAQSTQPILEAIEQASDAAALRAEAAPTAFEAPFAPPPAAEVDDAPQPVADIAYEPDQERREKFFSRFSRWGKKA